MPAEWIMEKELSFQELVESWLYDHRDAELLAKYVGEMMADLLSQYPTDLNSAEKAVLDTVLDFFEGSGWEDQALAECAVQHGVGAEWEAFD